VILPGPGQESPGGIVGADSPLAEGDALFLGSQGRPQKAACRAAELEQGRRPRVRPSTLRKLAAGLGVTVADLYTGVPDPKASAPASHELTLEWLLGADNRDRHTALQASTAEERERLVKGDNCRACEPQGEVRGGAY
jgi:hypothetical protein